MSEETNANINLLYKVLVPRSLFMSFSFQFFYRVLFYGRYFSLYSPLELSSFYTCSSSKPLLEQLSNQLSSSAFLNDYLPGNTLSLRQVRFVDMDQDSTLINLDSHKPKAQYTRILGLRPYRYNIEVLVLNFLS